MVLKTFIGEHGATLSGGQKQRLAIAKALYRQPEIFILDEASSNLDFESEQVVHETMHQLIQNAKTVVLIAHRLSKVIDANDIIVLQAGWIIECGSHAKLFAHDGNFYRIWQR